MPDTCQRKDCKIKAYLAPKIMTLATTGKMPPDFSRAFLRSVRLDSHEWLFFEHINNAGTA